MKLSTIWTTPAMSIRERIRRTIDWAALTIATRMPKRIRYWAFIVAGNQAMPEDAVIPEARFMDLLGRVDGGPK